MNRSLIGELFGRSPFGSLLEHTRKVQECVRLVKPLLEACVQKDWEGIHRLQDSVSKLEYEADMIKHQIREHLPRRFFLPVDRDDLYRYLHSQDEIADYAQDFAVVLLIRQTEIHPGLVALFRGFADQVVSVGELLLAAAEDIDSLAEAAFGGAQAEQVLKRVGGLNEGEWKADRMQRALCIEMYRLEKELDPVTISFYEKMILALGGIANAAENTGDVLRQMIVKR